MIKVLVSAYAISPMKGSEFAVAWNFVTRIAEKNFVYLICGVNKDNMGEFINLDDFFDENIRKNIKTIYVKPPKIAAFINMFNKLGLSWMFYIAFNIWQRCVFKKVMELKLEYSIDLVHQLNPIGFREPGYLWRLNKPYVWGPIGGVNLSNTAVTKSLAAKLKFSIRNFVTNVQLKNSSRLSKIDARSTHYIFCNSENYLRFAKYYKCEHFNIITEQHTLGCVANRNKGDSHIFKLLFIGTVDHRKNLEFIIDAVSMCKNKTTIEINVFGDGPLTPTLKKMATGKNVKVAWHGHVQRNFLLSSISEYDLYCTASLSEASSSAIFEATQAGLPTIALNQNSFTDILKNGSGILVDVSSYKQTVEKYAKAIDRCINDKSYFDDICNNVSNIADNYNWTVAIEMIEKIYKQALCEKH